MVKIDTKTYPLDDNHSTKEYLDVLDQVEFDLGKLENVVIVGSWKREGTITFKFVHEIED